MNNFLIAEKNSDIKQVTESPNKLSFLFPMKSHSTSLYMFSTRICNKIRSHAEDCYDIYKCSSISHFCDGHTEMRKKARLELWDSERLLRWERRRYYREHGLNYDADHESGYDSDMQYETALLRRIRKMITNKFDCLSIDVISVIINYIDNRPSCEVCMSYYDYEYITKCSTCNKKICEKCVETTFNNHQCTK